ncbi:hypothetical protein ABIE35_000059 [Paenarthrobacter sp. 4246]
MTGRTEDIHDLAVTKQELIALRAGLEQYPG